MACSKCNNPCIKVGGKCIIALIRKETNLSFREVWEALTHVSLEQDRTYNHMVDMAYVPQEIDTLVDNILNKQHKLIKQYKLIKQK